MLYSEQYPVMWTIMFHLLKHVRKQLERWGPVRDTWMFSYESFFGFLKQYVRNKSTPVQTILVARSVSKSVKTATELLRRARLERDEEDTSIPTPTFVRDPMAPKQVLIKGGGLFPEHGLHARLRPKLLKWLRMAYAEEYEELVRRRHAAFVRITRAG
jgi:hypothetical protein